jgi:hypothetical protein
MNCIFHNIPIGTKLQVPMFMCMPCGEINECAGVLWTYLGEESPTIHIVNPDTPLTCNGCGHVSRNGRVVCGKGWLFEIVGYPVSEVVNLHGIKS